MTPDPAPTADADSPDREPRTTHDTPAAEADATPDADAADDDPPVGSSRRAAESRATAQGITVPLPALDTTPAAWREPTLDAMLDAFTPAPRDYHVRAWVVAATGGVLEVVTTPPTAAATDTPAIEGTASDGTQTAREHIALYEVVVPGAVAVSLDREALRALGESIRGAHADFMADLDAAVDGQAGQSASSGTHPRYEATAFEPVAED